ncbi:cupin domain-containing protein, partial [Paracoccus sp. APAP_BH8]|uniref:cupin domain-containing protein n=1 Tax=Paracoccus sp. APAP_BH8 TaxID=3110237 RepID=UPI002FD7C965
MQRSAAHEHWLYALWPGADTGETMLAHHGSEGGIVIAGEIELIVADQSRVLKAGDS